MGSSLLVTSRTMGKGTAVGQHIQQCRTTYFNALSCSTSTSGTKWNGVTSECAEKRLLYQSLKIFDKSATTSYLPDGAKFSQLVSAIYCAHVYRLIPSCFSPPKGTFQDERRTTKPPHIIPVVPYVYGNPLRLFGPSLYKHIPASSPTQDSTPLGWFQAD